MVSWRLRCIQAGVLAIGAIVAAGCSSGRPESVPLVAAVSKEVGLALPADTVILAYHHHHDGKDGECCSRLWILRASVPFLGQEQRPGQSRAKSPLKSLKTLVEQATNGHVVMDAGDKATCECIEWRNGGTVCRLRQARTRAGWIAAMEAVKPE